MFFVFFFSLAIICAQLAQPFFTTGEFNLCTQSVCIGTKSHSNINTIARTMRKMVLTKWKTSVFIYFFFFVVSFLLLFDVMLLHNFHWSLLRLNKAIKLTAIPLIRWGGQHRSQTSNRYFVVENNNDIGESDEPKKKKDRFWIGLSSSSSSLSTIFRSNKQEIN